MIRIITNGEYQKVLKRLKNNLTFKNFLVLYSHNQRTEKEKVMIKMIEKNDVKVENAENFHEVLEKGVFFNFGSWTDVYPGVITKVINAKTIEVEELDHIADKTKEGGMGHQNWIIYKSETPRTIIFTKRKNGRWIQKGKTMKSGLRGSISEAPYYYYDWSF